MTEKRRPGRRPGSADTRGEILTAARRLFADHGFDRTTVRGIAREAAVDPALVHHYFATKEGMFVAAMQLPFNPAEVVPFVLDGPREEIGERMVRFILTITADPEARQPLMALIRSVMSNEQAGQMVREFVTNAVLFRLADGLSIPRLRVEAAFAQLFGVVMARYVVRMEPIASAEIDDLVALLSPTIQHYLGDDKNRASF